MDENGVHRAHESIEALINDLAAQGVQLRLGGIKFNNPYNYGTDSLDMNEFRSLSAFTTAADFIQQGWLFDGYNPYGGDGPELQLDALHCAAQDVGAQWYLGAAYIVLVTDNVYHEHEGGSTVGKADVINELTATGCPVYLSLWDTTTNHTYLQNNIYYDLNVNGGEFDPSDYSFEADPLYPLANLRTRILADLGN